MLSVIATAEGMNRSDKLSDFRIEEVCVGAGLAQPGSKPERGSRLEGSAGAGKVLSHSQDVVVEQKTRRLVLVSKANEAKAFNRQVAETTV